MKPLKVKAREGAYGFYLKVGKIERRDIENHWWKTRDKEQA